MISGARSKNSLGLTVGISNTTAAATATAGTATAAGTAVAIAAIAIATVARWPQEWFLVRLFLSPHST